ncbi:hypothetical protein BJ546DRAFT_957278 [Cryomyces antarcticus]
MSRSARQDGRGQRETVSAQPQSRSCTNLADGQDMHTVASRLAFRSSTTEEEEEEVWVWLTLRWPTGGWGWGRSTNEHAVWGKSELSAPQLAASKSFAAAEGGGGAPLTRVCVFVSPSKQNHSPHSAPRTGQNAAGSSTRPLSRTDSPTNNLAQCINPFHSSHANHPPPPPSHSRRVPSEVLKYPPFLRRALPLPRCDRAPLPERASRAPDARHGARIPVAVELVPWSAASGLATTDWPRPYSYFGKLQTRL